MLLNEVISIHCLIRYWIWLTDKYESRISYLKLNSFHHIKPRSSVILCANWSFVRSTARISGSLRVNWSLLRMFTPSSFLLHAPSAVELVAQFSQGMLWRARFQIESHHCCSESNLSRFLLSRVVTGCIKPACVLLYCRKSSPANDLECWYYHFGLKSYLHSIGGIAKILLLVLFQTARLNLCLFLLIRYHKATSSFWSFRTRSHIHVKHHVPSYPCYCFRETRGDYMFVPLG